MGEPPRYVRDDDIFTCFINSLFEKEKRKESTTKK